MPGCSSLPCPHVSDFVAAGTYLYMSPEMIRHELYNSRTDVYSWGVMFVELLTQQRPYERLYMTPVQVSSRIC